MIYAGVDTHKDFHVLVVLDGLGRPVSSGLLMFTKKWSEWSLGNELREHEKMSSLSKRAAPRGPGAWPSPYGFPGGYFGEPAREGWRR